MCETSAEKPVSALARAVADVERGEYGLARRRLYPYARTKGYDADVLARIGQICHDMHDPQEAGRFWLMSSASGEHVDRAVALFCKQAGKDPNAIVGQLTRFCRLESIQAYPRVVQERLRAHGLADALERAAVRESKLRRQARSTSWGDRIGVALAFMALAFFLTGFVVGVQRLLTWLF